jgi:uncharacterized protein YceK
MKYLISLGLTLMMLSAGCGTVLSQIDGHKKISAEKTYQQTLEKYESCKKSCDPESAEKLEREIEDYRKIKQYKCCTGCSIAVPNIYSGVASDLTTLLAPWLCRSEGDRDIATSALYPLYAPVFLVDTVLSAAMDTVILPYTLYRQVKYGNIQERLYGY